MRHAAEQAARCAPNRRLDKGSGTFAARRQGTRASGFVGL
jgi:hypothetical protein